MSNLQITIEYQTYLDSSTRLVEISPEVFFDLDPEEEPSIDESVPDFNHAIDYLDCPLENIKETKLIVLDIITGNKDITNEIYWNSGKNFVIQSYTFRSGKISSLTITNIRISDCPVIDEILRFDNEEFDSPKLMFHLQIQTHDDGSETEKVIYPQCID